MKLIIKMPDEKPIWQYEGPPMWPYQLVMDEATETLTILFKPIKTNMFGSQEQ